MKVDVQEKFEELLGQHLHRERNLYELVSTDNGSPLRRMSIKKRTEERDRAVQAVQLWEQLFDGDYNTKTREIFQLTIPDWYFEKLKEVNASSAIPVQ